MNGPSYSAAELLSRLVHFDTTSHKSNLALVRFVEDYLAQHGVESHLVPSADGAKASLYATIGPQGVPGVALSGHTDVVPVEGQTWSSDPFVLTERDRPLLRARHSRHEGLPRLRARCRARLPEAPARGADPASSSPTTRRSAASACAR